MTRDVMSANMIAPSTGSERMTTQDSCTTVGISQIPATTCREATFNEEMQRSMNLFIFLQTCTSRVWTKDIELSYNLVTFNDLVWG